MNHKRILEYENIKSPEELLLFMKSNIKYGFTDDDGNIYSTLTQDSSIVFQNACRTKWKLSSPNRLLNQGYGHCWDQVELERYWFKNNNYEFKTIFIWFLLNYDNSYTTHTFLVYKDKDGKWCWFEHSDYKNRGIHKFDSYEECIKYQAKRHIDFNMECGNEINKDILNCLRIYEYQQPRFGWNMSDFLNNIFNAREITPDISCFLKRK